MKLQISPVIAMNAFFSPTVYFVTHDYQWKNNITPGEIGYFILKTVKQQSDSLKVRDGAMRYKTNRNGDELFGISVGIQYVTTQTHKKQKKRPMWNLLQLLQQTQ